MPRFTLTGVSVSNYLSIANQNLTFPSSGLVYVQGDPGAGKTAIGEAMSTALFGVKSRYATAVKRVGDNGKGFSVKVLGDLDKHAAIVENSYKQQWCTGEGIKWSLDGEETLYSGLDNSRSKLASILGITPMEAKWCIFLDGEKMDWDLIPQAEATNFLMSLFQTPRFDDWREKAKSRLEEYTLASTTLNGKKVMLQGVICAEKERYVGAWSEEAQKNVEDQVALAETKLHNLQKELHENSVAQGQVLLPTRDKLDAAILAKAQLKSKALEEINHKISGIKNEIAIVSSKIKEVNVDQAPIHEAKLARLGLAKPSNQTLLDSQAKEREANREVNLSKQGVSAAADDLDSRELELKKALDRLEHSKKSCPTCGLDFVGAALERADAAEAALKLVVEKCQCAWDKARQAVDDKAEIWSKAATKLALLAENAAREEKLFAEAEKAYASSVKLADLEVVKATARVEELRKEKIACFEVQLEELRAKHLEIVADEQVAFADFLNLKAKAQQVIDEEQGKLDSHSSHALLAKLKALGGEINQEIQALKVVIREKQREADSLKSVKKDVENKEAIVKNYCLKLSNMEAEIADMDFLLKIVKYWHQASGPSGLSNMILEEIIPVLNAHSRSISEELTGGKLMIHWSAVKQKATGEDVAKLSWSLTDCNGKELHEGTSKGESSQIRFMICATLTQCAGTVDKCNWRWYDEVTAFQNSEMRQTAFSWMKRKALEENLLIFLVDHHPEAINYADYVLKTEKVDGATKYTWV